VGLGSGAHLEGQPAAPAPGAYTFEQAALGEGAYRKNCERCHLADLRGDQVAPPLVGKSAVERWDGLTVADLFTLIKTTMPPDTGRLENDADYLAIVSYILKMNGFPAGPRELDGSSAPGMSVPIRLP
jgi:mono/diheme cytochrome c family protein